MNKNELIILSIMKTFKGSIVNDYPCKNVKLSEAIPIYLEGFKSVNPRSVDRNKKGEI
jgi:hypothetical protein